MSDSVLLEQDELLALARIDVEKGELEAALIKLKQILMKENPIPDAISMLARLYAQIGLYTKAQEFFGRYVEMKPDADVEYFQLGMTYFESGQNERAQEIWDDILTKKPEHPPSLYYKSLILTRTDKHSEAKELLDVLLKTAAPDNLYFQRGKELLMALEAGKNVKEEKKESLNESARKLYETEH